MKNTINFVNSEEGQVVCTVSHFPDGQQQVEITGF